MTAMVDVSQVAAVEKAALDVEHQVMSSLRNGLANNDFQVVRDSLQTVSRLGRASYEVALDTYVQYSLQSLRSYAKDNQDTALAGANQTGSRHHGLLLSKLLPS